MGEAIVVLPCTKFAVIPANVFPNGGFPAVIFW
jgi:hypothetical protein